MIQSNVSLDITPGKSIRRSPVRLLAMTCSEVVCHISYSSDKTRMKETKAGRWVLVAIFHCIKEYYTSMSFTVKIDK